MKPKLFTIQNGNLHLPRWPRLDQWLTEHELTIVYWSLWFGVVGLALLLIANVLGGRQ